MSLLPTTPEPPARNEIKRVTSPDGHKDAVLQSLDYGATVSFDYEVYVVPHGAQIDPKVDKPVIATDAGEKSRNRQVEMKWLRPDYLQITTIGGAVWDFTNFTVVGGKEEVRVHLIDTAGGP